MSGYFIVSVANLGYSSPSRSWDVRVTLSSNDYKGTVTMTYTCVNTGSGSDPVLDKYTEDLWVDENEDTNSTVEVVGETPWEFTACGDDGSISDCDSTTDS